MGNMAAFFLMIASFTAQGLAPPQWIEMERLAGGGGRRTFGVRHSY
jgi:hypothetical protein